jgi:tripartite-type tricarboxylate transporter receptor subunit TctC
MRHSDIQTRAGRYNWHRPSSKTTQGKRAMHRVHAIVAIFALAAFSLGTPAVAHAQDWPQRPVRLIAPYAAGGNSDVIARMTAQRLSDAFGQSFVVENRVGGNGAIACEAVARAAPDGYTLLWGATPPLTINPALAKLGYDPIKDFAPVSVVASNAFVLVVNKDFPAKTIAEFISHVRAQPGKLSYAEGSVGSITHLGMALFLHRAGLEMANVSYRGNAPALTDVVAGHLPTMLSNISDAMPQAAAGAIRLLAVSSEQRSAQLPDVPTIAESGLPGFNVLTWNGVLAPAGTPKEIIDKMAAEIARMVKDAQFVARLEHYGADPVGNTPAAFSAMIASETALWATTVKSLGLKF